MPLVERRHATGELTLHMPEIHGDSLDIEDPFKDEHPGALHDTSLAGDLDMNSPSMFGPSLFETSPGHVRMVTTLVIVINLDSLIIIAEYIYIW